SYDLRKSGEPRRHRDDRPEDDATKRPVPSRAVAVVQRRHLPLCGGAGAALPVSRSIHLRERLTMTLGILLPTRGRPQNLNRFINAVKETADDWHLYLRLDTDDESAPLYDEVIDHD